MTYSVEYSTEHPETGERAIWFYMTFRAGGQVRAVETSDTMWDIGSLLVWLECIVSDTEICRVDVDREGEVDTLLSTTLDAGLLRLVIQDDLDDKSRDVYFDAVIDRRDLVEKTYTGLLQYIKSEGLVGPGSWTVVDGKSVYRQTTDLSSLRSKIIDDWLVTLGCE